MDARRRGAKRRGGRQIQTISVWFVYRRTQSKNFLTNENTVQFATTPALRATPPVPGGEFFFSAIHSPTCDGAQFQNETLQGLKDISRIGLPPGIENGSSILGFELTAAPRSIGVQTNT
jgi:hypothetical protein